MSILLYGATGYTGSLIARTARSQGIELLLAGRNRDKLASIGAETRFHTRCFALDDAGAVRDGIAGAAVVLNCAGPFIRTWRPLSDACLAAGAHYVDVTGEVAVFEALAARDGAARRAGVMLLPGAGFDVVPTDCHAAWLAGQLPGATRLLLGVYGTGPLSHGTAITAVENQAGGGRIRRGGVLLRVPAGWRTRTIDFGDGRPRTAVTIPWGDVVTAWHSTGIRDIEVYAAVPPRLVRAMRLGRYLGWLLRTPAVQALEKRLIRRRPPGPSAHELAHGESRVWGRVEDARGRHVEAVIRGPNGYRLTALAALHIARRAAAGDAPTGFRTPATAYGADLVLELPGTQRIHINGGEGT
jgi:short subunit dehydrogenase-like uncharacterized protein